MSDKLPYTINDPAAVMCPYCDKTMDVTDEVMSNSAYDINCEHCGRELHLIVDVEVTVLAWKPEALAENEK